MSTGAEVRGSAARVAVMRAAFRERFRAEPTLWVRAPGRVELMGSHTDYNLGHVLTLPIDRDTWIACRRRDDPVVHAFSLNLDHSASFALHSLTRTGDWGDYLRGVADVLTREGVELSGFDAIVHSTIPIGGGLSSSAAIEAAAAAAWQACGGWRLDPVRMARLCQRAENEFVGVNCGLLDQYSSCVDAGGGALLLDCQALTSEPSPIAPDIRVVVGDTCVPRSVGASEYSARRAECEEGARLLGARALRDVPYAVFTERAHTLPPVIAKRCQFIVEEEARVELFARALAIGNRAAIRTLASASYYGAVALFEIGVAAMDAMMDAMLTSPGVIGARQSGAGFGGCLVAFVEAAKADAFVATAAEAYRDSTGVTPKVFAVLPGRPAGEVSPE